MTMLGLAKHKRNLTPADQHPDVLAAKARKHAATQRYQAATTEAQRLRDVLSGRYDGDISWDMQREAQARLVPPTAFGMTAEEAAAKLSDAQAASDVEAIKAQVYGQLTEAVKEEIRDMLGEREAALNGGFELAADLLAVQTRTGINFQQLGSLLDECGENRTRRELAAIRKWIG
jgi:hypothetical protein